MTQASDPFLIHGGAFSQSRIRPHPQVGERYRHTKTGKVYLVLKVAKSTDDPMNRLADVVVYGTGEPLATDWHRPMHNFMDVYMNALGDYVPRFEKVEHV